MPAADVATKVSSGVVECSVRVEASPQTIFPFFTDPDKMCAWMGKTAELDPRPDGAVRVNVIADHVASGTYVEIDEPNRVVFSWGWEGEGHPVPPGSSTVEITLTPEGEATIVTLRHSGLPDDDATSSHSHGWTHYLQRLAVAGAGGDAGPDNGPGGS